VKPKTLQLFLFNSLYGQLSDRTLSSICFLTKDEENFVALHNQALDSFRNLDGYSKKKGERGNRMKGDGGRREVSLSHGSSGFRLS
jgi:hypothetical protein